MPSENNRNSVEKNGFGHGKVYFYFLIDLNYVCNTEVSMLVSIFLYRRFVKTVVSIHFFLTKSNFSLKFLHSVTNCNANVNLGR